ncbi:hypothetical protein [Polaribacter sp.]|uniref:hypothetical protein n=1 Tax=Polaribacter sp. TaxID=1920175 RepID=UPI003EF0ECE3
MIFWIFIIVLGLLLFYNLYMFHWPKGWKSTMYYKKDFSVEMCAIVGKKNRGEITEEAEFKALEKAYLANKATIDLYELIHNNGLLYGDKWNIGYTAMFSLDEHQTPIPIMEYWSDEFIQFSLKKIEEGAKPGVIARFYDQYLRKHF